MEHPSNTNQTFFQVVENLMLGKPCGLSESAENKLSFEDFLTVLSEVSEHSVSWREYPIKDKLLYLFSTEWQIQNPLPESNTVSQNFINKFFNSLVIEVSTDSVDNKDYTGSDTKNENENSNIVKTDYKVVMYGGPKVYDSNRDKTSLEKIRQFIGETDAIDGSKVKVYDAYEGTTINAFYYGGDWNFCTKRKFNMFESKFAKQRNHGEMVTDIIKLEELKSLLNSNFTYHFVLVHSDNSHLSDISENKLILTSVRNSSDFKEDLSEYERVLKKSSCKITEPTPRGLKGLDEEIINSLAVNSLSTQGVIIQYKDCVFRLYNTSYGEKLKQNPLFHTKHDRCFFDYQNNKYAKKDPNEVDSDEKTWTKAAFDFVAICLLRTLMHFTKFADKFTEEEKLSGYKFIKKNEAEWDDYILKHKWKNNALIRNLYKLQRLPYYVKDLVDKDLVDVDFDQVKHHLKFHCTPQDIKSMFDRFYLDINTDKKQPDDKSLCDIISYKCCNGVFNNIESFNRQQKNISKQDQVQGSYQGSGGGRGQSRGRGRGGNQSHYQGRGRGGYQSHDQGRVRDRGGYQYPPMNPMNV
jgi:hypothetical protein